MNLTGAALVALLAAVLVFRMHRVATLDRSEGICPDEHAPHPECYFSGTYQHARFRFREAALRVPGAKLHRIEVPGLDPEHYSIDAVILPGSESNQVLLHFSGTHGVEGFAGSAVQLAILDGWGARPRPTVVLIHAVNPFGMAHWRRWNEHGVDLNRNWLPGAALAEKRSRSVESTEYKTYLGLSSLLNLEHCPTMRDILAYPVYAAYAIARYGYTGVMGALVAGQYTHPGLLFYGGDTLQASHVALTRFLEKRFWVRSVTRVGVIDVHTGLGPEGVDTLLLDEDPGSATGAMLSRVLAGERVEFLRGPAGDTLRGAYSSTEGGLVPGVLSVFPSAGALGLTQEFGTKPGVLVALSLVLENAAYRFGDDAARTRFAQWTRDAFALPKRPWKRAVVRRGLELFNKVLDSEHWQ